MEMNNRISRRKFLKLTGKFLALGAAVISLPGGMFSRYIIGTKRFNIPIKQFERQDLFKYHNYAG
jgi:hypothetical protein